MLEGSPKKSRGEFFGVDRLTWARLCDSANINEAVAYLVLAQGTGRDNRSTSWSATSLKKYAGISWERGKVAIEGLIREGFIKHGEMSSSSKPRYELLSQAHVVEEAFDKVRAALTDYERLVLSRLQQGVRAMGPRKKHHSQILAHLEKQGLISLQANGSYTVVERPVVHDPDLIWLPNTLVTGTEKGEDSPVRRLRSGGDIWTLRLFIDLYHAQNLRDDGGVSPTVVRERYGRIGVGEQGIFSVWGFKPESLCGSWTGPLEAHKSRPKLTDKSDAIWESIARLQKHGLLTFVPHLWDNEFNGQTSQAEIIHGYGIGAAGEPLEIEMGNAAHKAAVAMVPEFKREKAICEGYCYFAPVPNTVPNVQMIGIARLLYRPHTTRTSDWYGDLVRNGPGWIRRYEELREKVENLAAKSA